MARIDFLVDGVKHRFVLSTATTDSIFPEHLVPTGRLVQKGQIRLANCAGNEFNTCGLYQAVLEFPNMDYHIPFTLNVVKRGVPVLGNDFLDKESNYSGIEVMKEMCIGRSTNYLEVVNQKGITLRLPLTIQHGPEEDGTILIPAVQRVHVQASPPPPPEPTRLVVAKNVVFLHLETTGFGNDAEIIQIGASCRSKTFNKYILPDGDIHCKATVRNGFSKAGIQLLLRGQVVCVTPRLLAVEKFLSFLRGVGGNTVLAAHNALPFHAPLLTALLASTGMSRQFEAQVRGLADTLPLFRKALKGRVAAGNTFSLEDLAKNLLEESVPCDAEETVATLEKLIRKVGIGYKEVIKSAIPISEFLA